MSELKPTRVFEQFAKINQIPRPSKHEEQMIEYLKKFGTDRNLEVKVDKTGNVIIRKPATKGYENRATTILQSHMDMVCDKLVDIEFDFKKDAIQTYVEDSVCERILSDELHNGDTIVLGKSANKDELTVKINSAVTNEEVTTQ